MAQWVGWYEAIEGLIDTLPESQFAPWQISLIEKKYSLGKSFLANSTPNRYGSDITARYNHEPVFTQTTFMGHKAFLLRGDNTSTVRPYNAEEPAPTTTASEVVKSNTKAWLEQGKVVMMTPRANARFQSFPDSYILPDKKSLAQKIIGNAIPPLGAYHFAKELIR
jgi:DNA (cytosine-5)-methyltransferase 1